MHTLCQPPRQTPRAGHGSGQGQAEQAIATGISECRQRGLPASGSDAASVQRRERGEDVECDRHRLRRASRQKRLRVVSSSDSDEIIFSATGRCSRSSRAAYTTPIPPWPSL
jgi:hypothetical protein